MKKSILTLFALIFGTASIFAQRVPPPVPHKVQVAILLDTSGSMSGLIDQAKARIWNIVNEVSELTYEGQVPTVEFALYHYGNDQLPSSGNYIEQILPLSTDLDELSQKLFALSTNGGDEYCGAVIGEALNNLNWSTSRSDLKMIYIAGNESFNQGPIHINIECKKAVGKDIFINTIFCGDYDEGIREGWKDGALCSQGNYFNIDSNKEVVHVATPYDQEIQSYNDSINTTYYGYGALGDEKKIMQLEEDVNSEEMSPTSATERSIVKSKTNVYNNSSWDLVDAADGGLDVLELSEEQLPEEFQGKTDEEKLVLIEENREERILYQNKIAELAKKRQDYIDVEMKKRAELGEVDDFGTSVNESIILKAIEIGFSNEAQEE
ncbi:MAG: VWA domain-containing protein [Crocinitomicaceae bacterium]|nr:VWA domain-containing protein [Crocinitomicaceae bacterium]